MTLLTALAAHYDRLAAQNQAPVPGYSAEKISFALLIDAAGNYAGTVDLRDGGERGRPRPRLLLVPQGMKRTVQVAPNLLWDKTSYVLGATAPPDAALPPEKAERALRRTADEHAAFIARQREAIGDSADEGLRALLRFLDGWSADRYPELAHADAMLDTNVVFRLVPGPLRFLHERPAARALVARLGGASSNPAGLCLVTGERAPIARLHPSIKGVRGAQSSGAAIVSFNQSAFTSYGKEQGANAPVSEAAAFAYTTALNQLLAQRRHKLQIGDASTVFWVALPPGSDAATEAAAAATEDLFGLILGGREGEEAGEAGPPDAGHETEILFDALGKLAAGRPVANAAPALDPRTRFFVLGLAPNAARLSVRFWLDTTIGDLARRLEAHYRDLMLEPRPWPTPPPVWRLLYELAPQRKAENVPAHLAGELTRAILTGERYPLSLLTLGLTRLRADHNVTPLRVAMVKATLVRQRKEVPVSLDKSERNPGYRLGRLFAVLEQVQRAGVGDVNATIRDRYIGAASATPGRVFPILLRGAQDHLSAIRKKDGNGRLRWFETHIREIEDGLDAARPYPALLSLEDQGRFFTGFYHQQAALFRKRMADGPAAPELDSEAGEHA